MLEQRFLLGSRRERKRTGTDRGAAKLQRQVYGAWLYSVIPNGNKDLPHRRVSGGAAQTDFSQATVFRCIAYWQNAQIGDRECRQAAGFRYAPGAREYDLAGTARTQRLNLARELESLLQVQGGGAGFRRQDRFLDLGVVGFEACRGSCQGV